MSENPKDPSKEIRASVDKINEQIATRISQKIDQSNPDELVGRLAELANLIPTSARALAMAEMLYNQKVDQLLEDKAFAGLSATDKRWYVQAKAAKENALVTYTERLGKGLTSAMDAMRTIISYVKSELENLKHM